MIWQHNCEWNCWRGEYVLERPSSETQSVCCHGVLVCRVSGFHCGDVFLKQRFCHCDSVDISLALRYSSNDSVPSCDTVLLWVRNLEKQHLPQKENVQEGSLHLELLRTSNNCVRLLSEVLHLRECADDKGRHLTDTTCRK
jgi:hypothetical protein